jgi:putative ABC transport system permease protein
VTAASDGVRSSQASVLHALYGVGTDLTITQPPPAGSGKGVEVGIRQQVRQLRKGNSPGASTTVDINTLVNNQYGTLGPAALSSVSRSGDVTAAVGSLLLSDVSVTGTVPPAGSGGRLMANLTTRSFSVDGVDVARTSLGPLSAVKLVSGSAFTAADADAYDALVDSGYAGQNGLRVGSTIQVGGSAFKVTGVVSAPQGANPPDVYIPLARAQAIGKTPANGSLAGQVNTIYVSAVSAADIGTVQSELARELPAATITDQDNLASEVTGSLSSASSLANNLGKWLSVAVLAAAFLLASLLTMAAVTRRVREFGTLKALGWRSRRVVSQVMGESFVIGILGGAVGIALGYAGATLIDTLAPKLSATVGASNGAAVGSGGHGALRSLSSAPHTVSVSLTAPVTLSVIGLAVALAVAGGLIAGSFGGWRAARLRPAAALARVA